MDSKYTMEDLKQDYPFSFKICTRDFIEKAQLEKNNNFAFLELTPMGDEIRLLVHLIVNCEDGKLISYGEYFNGFGDAYSNFVNKDHVKSYIKYSDYAAYKKSKKESK